MFDTSKFNIYLIFCDKIGNGDEIMRILVIEDEFNLADVISCTLKKENYDVDIKTDGYDGFYSASTNVYDLIILDVMLPNMNGFEILKELRKKEIDSKVIMLTAKSSLENKLDGLENGANDYITKPFHIEELVARVNIWLKDSYAKKDKNLIYYNDLILNTKTSKLTCITSNQTVELICKEFKLLEYFINNKEQILTKEQIYDKVWGLENEIESNNLEVYLSFLRKKLKAIDSNSNIKSLRGIGYRLEKKDE